RLRSEERAPVERCQAEPADRLAVVARGIALVVLPAVAPAAGGEAHHHPLPDDLGNDRRARDRVHLGVAVDDVGVWPDLGLEPDDPVSVDYDVLVTAEPADGSAD